MTAARPITCCSTGRAGARGAGGQEGPASIWAAARRRRWRYADQLGVPFMFLSNGEEVWFRDKDHDAHFRPVATVFSQDDLERRQAARGIRRSPLDIAIDRRIAGGGGRTFQIACIETLCREIVNGPAQAAGRDGHRHRQDADGRGPDQAAVRGELDDPRAVPGRSQHARHPDRRRLRRASAAPALLSRAAHRASGSRTRSRSRSSRCKRWSTSIANYSAGYFDLVIIDECHRSIYGKWRRALDHFDAVKIGLTATPCVMRDAPDDRRGRPRSRSATRSRFFEVERPTYSYTLTEAIADGHLVPYEIYRAHDGEHRRRPRASRSPADEIDWDALDEQTRAELEALFAGERSADRRSGRARTQVHDPGAQPRDGARVSRGSGKGLYRPERRPPRADWGKTIVFAVTKRHAETLARLFDQEFADKKPSPTTALCRFRRLRQGPDDTVDGAGQDQAVQEGGVPADPVSVNMLDTGFDCPEVRQPRHGALHASSDPLPQMRGRGTRLVAGQEPLHDVRFRRASRCAMATTRTGARAGLSSCEPRRTGRHASRAAC